MNLESNPVEFTPMDSALEQAVNQIREDAVDEAAIEAAASRVWANLAAQYHAPLHSCEDFQAVIPEFKSGQLAPARALLVKDHLHECVACRRVYEGRVTVMPAPAAVAKRKSPTMRWAVAAAVVAAAGLSVWFGVDQFGNRTGRAYVQAVNGTLYEILPAGIQVLAQGQELPDGVEIRTAQDSGAMVELKDGSVVELRERSAFSTSQTAKDLTIRLGRGSIIVQAAHRSSGHLYVTTADCRVAVTGTVFGVTSGVKGSRVSVVEGEVHVTQESTEKILHPGEQSVSSPNLEPVTVKDEIGWSRNREKLIQQLDSLRAGLAQVQLPELRYTSRLLDRLPETTVFYGSIPNLAGYLAQAQGVFEQKLGESPELRAWWGGRGASVQPILEKLRAASEYLGDEIAVVGFTGADGQTRMPVFFAEVKKPGLAEWLKQQKLPLTLVERNGLVAFGGTAAVDAFAASLDAPRSGFANTPFHARIEESYKHGAGLLMCADLGGMGHKQGLGGARYVIAEARQVNRQFEASGSLGFDGPRSGMAAWLASPAPMGALDYVSPEATIVTAFVAKSPVNILNELVGLQQHSPAATEKAFADLQLQTGIDLRKDLAAAMGGEFSLSLDGAAIPVPSWKLVAEVYDPARMQATLGKFVEAYNRETVKGGGKALRTAQETVEGRTYYMIAGADGSPLTEAHYTFADGYMLAGPSRALVARALQVKAQGTSITHSANFVAMLPRDHYNNFSALIYQNLGTSLAPIVNLFSGMMPQGRGGQAKGTENGLANLGNMKSTMIAAYGEPDRISVATSGNLMGMSLNNLMTGNLQGAIPFSQFMGTRERAPAFK